MDDVMKAPTTTTYDVTTYTDPNITNATDAAPAPELPLYTCMIYMYVASGFVQCVLYVIAAVGNSLCFFTWNKIGRSKGCNSSVVLMQSLAVSDMFTQMPLLFIWVLPNVLVYSGDTSNPYLIATNAYNAKYGWPVASLGNFCTVMLTTLITVHRYCVLSKPFSTFTRKLTSITSTSVQVVCVFVFGVAYQIPRVLGKDIVEKTLETGEIIKVAEASYLELRHNYQLWYFSISYIVLVNALPLLISGVFTILILRLLNKAKSARKNMTNDSSFGKEREITVVLLTVVILFIICQIPNTLVRVYLAFRPNTKVICGSAIFYLYTMAVIFISLNSSINIFIYARSQEFRNTLKSMCGCGGKGMGDRKASVTVTSSIGDSSMSSSKINGDASLSSSKISVTVVDSPI